MHKYTKKDPVIHNIHHWLSDKTLLDAHLSGGDICDPHQGSTINYPVSHLYLIHPTGEKVKKIAEIGGRYPKH